MKVLEVLALRDALPNGALARAQAAGGRVDRMLLDLGLVSEERMAAPYASALELPLGQPDDLPSEALFEDVVNPSFLVNFKLLPLSVGEGVTIGVADPLDTIALQGAIFMAGQDIPVFFLALT